MTYKSDRFYDWLKGLFNSLSRRFLIVPRWLQVVTAIALILGIGLRFTNLDTQVFGSEETYTLLRVSGYTVAELESEVFTGDMVSRSTLAQFQYPKPNSNLNDTIFSLAVEQPQSPPLYYVLTRFWVEVWGNSVLMIRCWSAIISLSIFPSMYWLCRELFPVPHAVGVIAIASVAVSPIHLLFAQEAQESTLWMVTILSSSAALLRAIRLHDRQVSYQTKTWSWIIYACILSANFYTSLLGVFVAVSHGVYVLFFLGLGCRRLRNNYATAVLGALAAYVPWVLLILNNYESIDRENTSLLVSRLDLIRDWWQQIRRIFFDFNINVGSEYEVIFTSFFVLLVAYAIYFLLITTSPQTWGAIVALIVIPTGVIVLSDFGLGESRSLVAKNMIPAYLGMQIAVIYLLAYHVYNGLTGRRKIWQGIILGTLLSGLFSSIQIVQSDVWWNKSSSYGNPEIANIINRSNRPVLIASNRDVAVGNILSLSYSLQPPIRYQLILGNNIPSRINSNNRSIFLLNPASRLRRSMEREYGQTSRIRYRDRYLVLYQLNRR